MGLVNWRRELMIIALAGMEACWLTGLARVLIKGPGSAQTLVSWWSVFLLFLVALAVVRVVGRLELRYGRWLTAGLTLLTAALLVQFSLDQSLFFLRNPSDPASGRATLVFVLGFVVWYRALRITGYAGDTRDTIRQFQFGLLVLVGVTLVTLRSPARMTDLVFGYFGFGLLAVALTRIEEVAQTEPAGAAPLDLKWVITLAVTLLTVGAVVLLVGQVITIDAVRWVLRPFVTLLEIGLVALVFLVTFLMMQFLPLLSGLFANFPAAELEDTMQDWQESAGQPFEGEPTKGIELSAELLSALQWTVIVVLVAVALWLIARSFRRWRLEQSTTPGGVRESVSSEGTIADDVARYLRDQWGRLRNANLGRLFQRVGAESVRAIYVNLLMLMSDAGCPRLPEQTPNEFCPAAADLLPARRTEIQAITEAYVRAHYGEVDISADELARIQDAWQRVKADAEALPKAGFRGYSL
jgi:hypothetical protein